jgi:hypothetical protein
MGYTLKQKRDRIYVTSKILYFIEFNKETNLLKVGFNDGAIGYFQDVPKQVIKQFKLAKSKGEFFYRNLYQADYKREIRYL